MWAWLYRNTTQSLMPQLKIHLQVSPHINCSSKPTQYFDYYKTFQWTKALSKTVVSSYVNWVYALLQYNVSTKMALEMLFTYLASLLKNNYKTDIHYNDFNFQLLQHMPLLSIAVKALLSIVLVLTSHTLFSPMVNYILLYHVFAIALMLSSVSDLVKLPLLT